MKFGRFIRWAAIALALLGFSETAKAEIVERELGTDVQGNAVKGYVFQGGRGFGRSSSRRSSLPVRRVSRSRWSSRGIDNGYGYRYPYFYLPYGAFHWRSPFSICRVPSHHFYGYGGASFSVRIYR